MAHRKQSPMKARLDAGRNVKTVLAFVKSAQTYRWTTDRSRPVVKN